MKAYALLRITPYRLLQSVGAHIDRLRPCKHVDARRTLLNEELTPYAGQSLALAVEQRIAQGYKVGRKIRKDARKALGVVLSASHARMKEIEGDTDCFAQWKAANYRFACDHFGEENLVRFTVHRDERTPHIHCVFVPITPDGRLSAKHFIGGKAYGAGREKLRAYQSAYAKAMQAFGLSRALPSTAAQRAAPSYSLLPAAGVRLRAAVPDTTLNPYYR